MTSEEIEQQARGSWAKLHYNQNYLEDYKVSEVWEYYLKAWQDACKVLYTEEDVANAWDAAAEYISVPKAPDKEQWIELLKQFKQQ